MTHALLLLAAASLLQVPDTSTYVDADTETLIVQARGRHAYQDSLIRDYSALVQTRIDVGFGRSRFARVPPIVAHETAARISWALPNDLKVDVVGQRAVSIFPGEDIEAEFDRPWFVPRGLGDSIRMVDDEIPTTAALHPLAYGAEEFYRYAIVDSLTLVIPGRTVRAIKVRVEPKELGPSLIAGDMWFDGQTLEVVRLTFIFLGHHTWVAPDEPTPEDSAAARRGNTWAQRIVKLEADLEYALYDRLYWMPYRQLLQLTVDIPWFINAKIPIRFLTTFSDYDVNASVLPHFEVDIDSVLEEDDAGERRWRRREGRRIQNRRVCLDRDAAGVYMGCDEDLGYSRAGPASNGGRWEVHYSSKDSLEAYAGWAEPLQLDLRPEDEERIKDAIASLGELEEGLPDQWVGRMPRHVAFESFSDIFRFNRVQGSSVGAGYLIRPGPAFTTLHGIARYGFSDRRPTGSLTWRRDAPGGRLDISGFRYVREVESWTRGSGFGNSLNAIFAGNDDADYYLALGAGISFQSYGRGLLRNATFAILFEQQRSMVTAASSGINDFFGGSGVFPANTPVLEGDFVRAYATRRSFVGPIELQQGVEALVGEGMFSGRLWGAGRLPFRVVQRSGELNVRAGGLAGDEVLQMRYRVGGPQTVRGFDYGARMGSAFWSAQIDVSLLKDAAVSPVVFADIGDATFSTFDPLVAVGGGVSLIQGWIRFNVSKASCRTRTFASICCSGRLAESPFVDPRPHIRFFDMSDIPFIIDEYVRWSDVDYAGIIFYGAYVRFFEIAETELFRSLGVPYSEVFDRFDIWLPRVHFECDFMYPARLDDRLRVAAYVARFGNTSITLNFDVLHLGSMQLAAAGHEVLVATERSTLKPRPLPEGLRSILAPFHMSAEAGRKHLLASAEAGA